MLYLTEIIRNLEEEYHVSFIGGCSYGLRILSCQIISGQAPETLFPSCLYIAAGEKPRGLLPETPCLITGAERKIEGENLYYCREVLEPEKVFQSIQRMIYFRLKLMENKEKLLKSVQNGIGEEAIIKEAARHLGNPVYLCNLGLRIMYQYPDEVDDNMIGDEGNGRYIINIESVRVDRLIQRILDSKIPFMQVSPYFEYRMLIAPVRIRDVAMGFIFVKETQKDFSEEDIDYLSILGDIFSIELQKRLNIAVPRTQQQEAFIEEILSDRTSDEDILRQRLELMDLSFRKYMWFGRIPLKKNLKQIHIQTYMEGLRRILPKSIIIYRDFSIIILSDSSGRDHYRKEDFWESLEIFLGDYHFIMAVSYGFSTFLHAGAYFRQTGYLLEEGKRQMKEETVLYPDMDLAAVLFHELRDRGQAVSCIHPDLKTLDVYDRLYHTEYIPTLKAYLECGRNAKKAAEKLHIHKSTFHFRISKIGEVIDFHMTDTKKLFYYELGFALKRTLEH